MQHKGTVASLAFLVFTVSAELANGDGDFPRSSCRAGYVQAGPRLCISDLVQSRRQYDDASRRCRRQFGHVCSYEDFNYMFTESSLDVTKSPGAKWIGNFVGDNQVLCGNVLISIDNDPDEGDFEETCSKQDSLTYFCCHDDDSD